MLANGTIESTRLAMESFETPLMGRNLVAHLRSNTVVRIKRDALGPGLPTRLEAGALLVRGSTPHGTYHLQVTAAAVTGADSEATMFRMIPDIDLLDRMLASQLAEKIVITFRGIGEMRGSRDPNAAKVTAQVPSWMDLSPDQRDEFGMRRAWVNLVPTPEDFALWRAMDDAALAFAQRLAGSPDNIEYFYNRNGSLNSPGAAWHAEPPPASTRPDRNDPANKVRDGVGTTHHEAGTLWMSGTGSFMELGANIIESVGGPGILWFAEEQFDNFVLRVDWRASDITDNSGVFIRFPALGGGVDAWKVGIDQGYEIQIDERGINPDTNQAGDPLHQTGAVYTLAAADQRASRPVGEWNTFEIEARGPDISVTLNGTLVSQLTADGSRPSAGHIGLQNHHQGSRVQFRNIQVESLAVAARAGALRAGRRAGARR